MKIPGYQLILDISYYQQALDWSYLKTWVDGFVIRSLFGVWKDPMFRDHVSHAVDAGYESLATYAWLRPDESIKAQLDKLAEQLYGTPIKVVFVDVEQHGRTYLNLLPHYSPEKLSDLVWQYVSGIKTLGIIPAIYTRSTWVSTYARPLENWMYKFHCWLASYPFGRGRIALQWDDLLTRYAPKAFAPYYNKYWNTSNGEASAWQWSGDKFVLPGIYQNKQKSVGMPVDLNYFSTELTNLMTIGNAVPLPVDPVHETWVCLAAFGMKVRMTPFVDGVDTTIRVRFNQTFSVYEKVEGDGYTWGKLGEGRWVALNWSRRIS
ncbi:MAG: hypothetical protein CVU46_10500 [Chloroflexi bacterium HGW-Chloroflexi-8]|jgi:hypothetical protein|nr:MAG: hypothetical protein CVU46_10500 [Chloroflexi bacterium HGW-Chloroflexi-8]